MLMGSSKLWDHSKEFLYVYQMITCYILKWDPVSRSCFIFLCHMIFFKTIKSNLSPCCSKTSSNGCSLQLTPELFIMTSYIFPDLFLAFLFYLITKYTIILCQFPSQSLSWLVPINHLRSPLSIFTGLPSLLWTCQGVLLPAVLFSRILIFLTPPYHFSLPMSASSRRPSYPLMYSFLASTCLILLSNPILYFVFITLRIRWNYLTCSLVCLPAS